MERYFASWTGVIHDKEGEYVKYADHLQALTAVEQERDALKVALKEVNDADEINFKAYADAMAENKRLRADLTRLRALVADVAKSAMAVIEEHRGFVDEDDDVRNTWLDAHHLIVETAEQAMKASNVSSHEGGGMTQLEQKLLVVYRMLEFVASKGMIHMTDHHDQEAWQALKAAMQDVERLFADGKVSP